MSLDDSNLIFTAAQSFPGHQVPGLRYMDFGCPARFMPQSQGDRCLGLLRSVSLPMNLAQHVTGRLQFDIHRRSEFPWSPSARSAVHGFWVPRPFYATKSGGPLPGFAQIRVIAHEPCTTCHWTTPI